MHGPALRGRARLCLYTGPMSLIFGLFGLIIGSFLNVLTLRWGKESVGGRSRCPHCKHQIRWFDNIPLLSWLVLGGRCRDCKARISVQYPLVEALTAVVFALIAAAPLAVGVEYRLLFCLIGALLIAIAVHDIHTTIIPDAWVFLFDALALVVMGPLLLTLSPESSRILYLFAGPIVALPLFCLWLVSRGAWMGFGDVKFALGMGWLLGALFGLVALMLAFVVGAVIGVLLIAFTHTKASSKGDGGFTMKSEIPFAPFLVGSTLLLWLLQMYGIDPIAFVGLLPL